MTPPKRTESVSLIVMPGVQTGMAMKNFRMIGLALTVGGAIGLLAAELVAPAYASRGGVKAYVLAFSTGRGLILEQNSSVASADAARPELERGLTCRHVVGLIGARVGYNCH